MNDRKDNLPVTKDENIPPGSEKRKASLFVLLIPAVICIVFVLFTLFGYSSGLFLRIVPSCGVESHSVAVLGSRVYYYEDGYPYIYDLTAREKEYAYTKDGEPFENSLGLFVTGAHDGVYHVSYSNTKMIFEFEGTVGDEEKLGIVDITGNKVYWKVISHSDDRFTQKIYSGEYHEPIEELLCEIPDNITLIHTYTEEAVTPSTVKDDRLYYFSSDNSGSIKCVDILSGEESTLISGEGSEYTIEKAYFYDDLILLITPEGIYSLSYDGNTRLVTESKPVTSAFDRVDDRIYFVDENDCIVSVSIEKADFSDRTYERLSGINGLGHDVSELVITGDGFVFTDPSEGPGGGLYFYNRRHEKLIKISR